MASCRIAERFPHLQPFTAAVVAPMLTVADMVQKMELLRHWRPILKAYRAPNSAVGCWRDDHDWPTETNESSSSPYQCVGLNWGNTIFAPVLGSPKLSVLRELHDWSRCMRLVAREEKRTGVKYNWIVHTRLDFVWLRPHPPLSLLQRDVVWIPIGEDWGGYNDRHAVMSRNGANVALRGWDFIVSGQVMQIDPQLRAGAIYDMQSINSETYLYSVLHWAKLHVRRFPMVAYLACCGGQSIDDGADGDVALRPRCYTASCQTRSLPMASAVVATCLKNRSASPFAHETIEGKYVSEMEQAIKHALVLSIPGAKLSAGE